MPRLALLLALLLPLAACDSAEPEPRSMAGVWAGPITHPNPDFSGTLTLTVTQVGEVLTGGATWRFDGTVASGTLLGTLPESGAVTTTLDLEPRGIYFVEAALRGDALTGTWRTATGINGTLSLERE